MNNELERILIGTGSSAVTWLAIIARSLWRTRKQARTKSDIEETIRKELWGEINTLRSLLREATTSVIDWQAKYLSLLTKHESVVDELSHTQERLKELGGLLTLALRSLDRIAEVEQHLGQDLNLVHAKKQLDVMKSDATLIRQRAGELSQLAL